MPKFLTFFLGVVVLVGCGSMERVTVTETTLATYDPVFIKLFEPLVLPEYPEFPQDLQPGVPEDDERAKAWALQWHEVHQEREILMKGRIAALRLLIQTVNEKVEEYLLAQETTGRVRL